MRRQDFTSPTTNPSAIMPAQGKGVREGDDGVVVIVIVAAERSFVGGVGSDVVGGVRGAFAAAAVLVSFCSWRPGMLYSCSNSYSYILWHYSYG
jgi:hypothetical protein